MRREVWGTVCLPLAWKDPRVDWAPEDMLEKCQGLGHGAVVFQQRRGGQVSLRGGITSLLEPEAPLGSRCCGFVPGYRCSPASGLGSPMLCLLSAASCML